MWGQITISSDGQQLFLQYSTVAWEDIVLMFWQFDTWCLVASEAFFFV
jgi:hypothetical protein